MAFYHKYLYLIVSTEWYNHCMQSVRLLIAFWHQLVCTVYFHFIFTNYSSMITKLAKRFTHARIEESSLWRSISGLFLGWRTNISITMYLWMMFANICEQLMNKPSDKLARSVNPGDQLWNNLKNTTWTVEMHNAHINRNRTDLYLKILTWSHVSIWMVLIPSTRAS